MITTFKQKKVYKPVCSAMPIPLSSSLSCSLSSHIAAFNNKKSQVGGIRRFSNSLIGENKTAEVVIGLWFAFTMESGVLIFSFHRLLMTLLTVMFHIKVEA